MPLWPNNSVHVGGLQGAPSEDQFQLHLAAIEYELSSPITIQTKEDILSRKHWSERLEPFEHQVQNLITFCRRAPVALFADDVGLGKTISAGLVLNELQIRKKVRRALILCPKMLLPQWKEELAEKFAIHAAHGVGSELNQWIQHAVPVVITTYESACDRIELIRAASFDMVILDEAHKLRNLYGTARSPKLAKAIHGALANRDFKYVLMLTATPIQNRLWDMYSLIDCLSAAKGHENPLGNPQEFVQKYVSDGPTSARRLRSGTKAEFRHIVQNYMVRTSRSEARLSFPQRHVQPVQCEASAAEKLLQQLVSHAIGGLNSLAMTSLAEALMSSPRALLEQVRRMTLTGTISTASRLEFERGVAAAGAGCKLRMLHRIVQTLQTKRPGNWRALVFTRRLETLELISEGLREAGVPVVCIRGSKDVANQRSIKAFKAEPPLANVLVSTDAGAVGLNLQFCNIIINYDLPWNPMVLEQRIGRVQRLGSTFRNIEVMNLSVKDSVEDHIIARLISKLQLIQATIGDVEAILEASDFQDDEGFEGGLRELVIRALLGQDVGEALAKAQESIQRAKDIYDAERQQVDETLGGLDEMHRAGPAVPKLNARPPRFDVPTFCRKAFSCEGAVVQDLPNHQIRVIPPGRATVTATFDDHDPDLLRAGLGTFGGTTVQLYQEGSRAFEGLLGEFRRRHSHRVLNRIEESRANIKQAVQTWADSFGLGLVVKECADKRVHQKFQGTLHVRATASISHDKYEKLCVLQHSCSEDGTMQPPPERGDLVKDCNVAELIPEVRSLMTETVERDTDIGEFVRFYQARQAEEVQRAGRTPAQQQEVSRRYEVSLAADLVGAGGSRYASFEVDAVLKDSAGKVEYKAALHLVPLSGVVLSEPNRARCEETNVRVPQDWLGICSRTNAKVLLHLLETSPVSRITARSKFFGTCSESSRRLLKQELGKSEVGQQLVGVDLLKKSEVSGRRALEREMARCEVSGALAIPDELGKSGVSGRMVRLDRMIASAVSGVKGHRSEFRACESSHEMILEAEGGFSDVTAKFVSKRLLKPSEKNPQRMGLSAEFVLCEVTSRRILTDEAVKSCVSGLWVDKDEACHSGLSFRPALPSEMVCCSITGMDLLPEETGESAVSGRKVDKRLLIQSAISKAVAVEEELRVCEFTARRVLSTEGIESQVSGKFACLDQVVASVVSGVRGHRSEFVQCQVSGDWLLAEECGQSDLSGRAVRPDLLRRSERPPGRLGVEGEMVLCELSGLVLLRDEAERSAVSGKLVDKTKLMASEVSGRLAMESELVSCALSGIRLLPDEVGHCAITGKQIDLRQLVSSKMSGRRSTKDHLRHCQITRTKVLSDELEKSVVSGRLCRVDEMEASELSGGRGHRSELLTCGLTGQRLLPSEISKSSISGRVARSDLLVTSEKQGGRIGFPDEVVMCSASGRRLLADEVGISDASGKLVDQDLLIPSEASGRLGTAEEMLVCDESGVRLLSDETAVCCISGKRVDRRRLVESEMSDRLAISENSTRCEFSGRTVLVDEVDVSAVSGKKCALDLLEPSELSGKPAHGGELEACVLSGQRLLPSEVGTSALSQRIARLDLLIRSERAPHRLGFPDEVRVCSSSRRRLLSDEVRKSDVSERLVDADLSVVSEVSGRVGLPEEGVTCEESGKVLLQDETAVCSVTGKRVDRTLIGRSALSGGLGLIRLLSRCPETGSYAFPSELTLCAASGFRVAPSETDTCSVTGELVLKRLMVACAVTGRLLRRDKAQVSDKTSRCAHPDSVRVCTWSGARLLWDESRRCAITGLDFDSDLVPDYSPASPLTALIQQASTDSNVLESDNTDLRTVLGQAGLKVRRLLAVVSPNGKTICYFTDCSGLFGLKKRYAVGFATLDGGCRLLHAPCVGRLIGEVWTTDGI